jgi:hypothetical protein
VVLRRHGAVVGLYFLTEKRKWATSLDCRWVRWAVFTGSLHRGGRVWVKWPGVVTKHGRHETLAVFARLLGRQDFRWYPAGVCQDYSVVRGGGEAHRPGFDEAAPAQGIEGATGPLREAVSDYRVVILLYELLRFGREDAKEAVVGSSSRHRSEGIW